jgi:hypothetical protein
LLWEKNSRGLCKHMYPRKVFHQDLFHWAQMPRNSEATSAMIQGRLATVKTGSRSWHCPCGVVLPACRIQELWSYGVMEASTQISQEGPGDQAMCGKVRSPCCHRDLRMLEILTFWKCNVKHVMSAKERQWMEPAQERGHMGCRWPQWGSAIPHAPDSGCGATEFMFAPWVLVLFLVPFLLTFLYDLTGITAKRLSWVLVETLDLDFWTILELLRLWGLLKTHSMNFALQDGHESLGARDRMLWFEYKMYPHRLMRWTWSPEVMIFWEVLEILGGGPSGGSRPVGAWLW